MSRLITRPMSSAPDAIAPDGSEVRVLAATKNAGMAHFTLPPRQISRAVTHRTVEEIWCFVRGEGRMWRQLGEDQNTVVVVTGTSISIPTGTRFQFRCDTDEPLEAVAVTLPPWPGPDEALPVQGPWKPTV
jgi:mannose-6-phosphate isomerase-like protein (cupin superfamily)